MVANEVKYYYIRNLHLAQSISYITGQRFYTYDDRFHQGQKCYRFIKTDKFIEVLNLIQEMKCQYDN